MVVTKLYNRVNDLYEQYRNMEGTVHNDKAKRLIDESLYLCSELIEMIEQLKTDDLKNYK